MYKVIQTIQKLKQSKTTTDYLKAEYARLTDRKNSFTIKVSDFSGNSTKYHSLSVESLLQLAALLHERDSILGVEAPPNQESLEQFALKECLKYFNGESHFKPHQIERLVEEAINEQ